ncbi:Mediator complex subunit Med17 [Penicillium maclennaniae]|uniref:Mediator complex subunit Med17 n=1 Tax=Penicillium maclennaniae TaxID=1343394 RepID=UPI002542653B|nr:Mediator complex subunit Med17 [Penicillium maclennaniae]KAJ5667688.1 Mediator complex subunit Med17 [Penicillium maclennaniae]
MFALDFVSLLLSKHAPRQAETSMSAYLKQIAPVGSLNSEVVNPPPKPESTTKDVSTVSRGWRTQNFNSAAHKLLNASTRLEGEIISETRYWNEVLAIKENGWKICRLPRERQALGVQYGFLEATPVFRDRGLASLRRAENGSLILDKGLIPSGSRYVRVRVKQGSTVSTSSHPTESTSIDIETIEQRILQARDSVFEEELFHELVREARSMASSGVTTRENLIRIPASDEMEIQLDLVDSNDDSLQPDQNSFQRDSLLADGLAHSIRVLLAYAHRQNLHRRTQIPPPLTSKKRHTPEYQLLRPALAYLQHLSCVKWLESYFSDLFGVLRSSGLEISEYSSDTFSTWQQICLSPSAPTIEALVENFLRPIQSVFRGQLLTPNGSFAVTIRTNLSGPPFGTLFDLSFKLPTVSDLKSPGCLGMRDEVESAITHLLLLDVISHIASKELPAQTTESPDSAVSQKCKWNVVYPHLGELLLSSEKPEKHKKMKVSLTRSGLSLSSYVVRSIDGIGRGAQERPSLDSQPSTWTSFSNSTTSPDDKSSMMDFIVAQACQGE